MDRVSLVRSAVARTTRNLSRFSIGLATVGVGAALEPESASAASCIPTSSGGVFCSPKGPPTPPRTGGAVAQAWALGTLTEAVQPGTDAACDLSHVCDLVISSQGSQPGTGFTIQREFATGDFIFPGNLPFVLDEVIDYTSRSPNGVGGNCYPSTGTVSIILDNADKLVLDFQGQACQLGQKERTALLFSGAYTGDLSSTGTFANAEAIGSFQIEGPSGRFGSLTQAKVSLNGQLLLQNEPP